jgi:hypothetical protein
MLVEEVPNGAVVLQQVLVDERELGDQGERAAGLGAHQRRAGG